MIELAEEALIVSRSTNSHGHSYICQMCNYDLTAYLDRLYEDGLKSRPGSWEMEEKIRGIDLNGKFNGRGDLKPGVIITLKLSWLNKGKDYEYWIRCEKCRSILIASEKESSAQKFAILIEQLCLIPLEADTLVRRSF